MRTCQLPSLSSLIQISAERIKIASPSHFAGALA
jgi:hypothetical protein